MTVVEDFDPEVLLHGQNPPRLPEDDEQDTPMEDGRKAAPPKSTKGRAAILPKKAPSKNTKPKKIKYQTNAARKADRAKEQKRKVEKAERAGGKGSRKKGGKR